MAIINTNIFWKLAIFINTPKGGYAEGYCVGDATAPAILTLTPANLIQIVQVRHGLGATIEWVRLSRSDKAKQGYQLLTGAVGPIARASESPIDSVNMDGDGAMFRLETAGGKWENHGVRCLRDGDIVSRVYQFPTDLVSPSAIAYPANIDAGGTPQTGIQAITLWMQWLLMNTYMPHKNPRGSATKYTLETFEKVMFRKTFVKKLGRPFGAVAGRAPAFR